MTGGPMFWTRMRALVLGWGTVGLIYTLSRSLQGEGRLMQETPLDQRIPYDPSAIWFYTAFFAYVPWAYFAVEPGRLQWLRRSMQVCAVICGTIYLLWPTTLSAPALPPASPTEAIGLALLRLLHAVDTPQNCVPSLHAALTVLCAWALLGTQSALRYAQSLLALVLGAAIVFSIVQLRRHLVVDLVAGVAVGCLSGWLSGCLCQRWEKKV